MSRDPLDELTGGLTGVGADDGWLVDPIAGLPVTSSQATLVVSTFGDDPHLSIIDLAAGTATALDLGRDPHGPLGVGERAIWSVDLAGRLQAVGWDGEPVPDPRVGYVPVIGDVAGVTPLPDGALLVTAWSRQDPDVLTVLDHDGSERCSMAPPGPAPADWDDLFTVDGAPLSTAANCAAPLPPDGYDAAAVHEADDGTVLWLTGPPWTLVRATADGDVLGEAQLGEFVYTVARHDGTTWALDGDAVVALDAALEVVRRWEVDACPAVAYPIVAAGSVWVIDDCQGRLFRFDAQTGAVESWWFPHDNASDQQIHAVAASDGLWFVDIEQTGEPYFFDPDQERFERLPDELRDPDVYGLDFAVRPPS
jgi:hypothetical protein